MCKQHHVFRLLDFGGASFSWHKCVPCVRVIPWGCVFLFPWAGGFTVLVITKAVLVLVACLIHLLLIALGMSNPSPMYSSYTSAEAEKGGEDGLGGRAPCPIGRQPGWDGGTVEVTAVAKVTDAQWTPIGAPCSPASGLSVTPRAPRGHSLLLRRGFDKV